MIWAVGFRRSYPWLPAGFLDADGEIRQTKCRTDLPGPFALGLAGNGLYNSTLIDGAGRDVGAVCAAIADRLGPRAA